ncbi:MAG: PAC2 family protein [Dehalococcoidia bacterium]|tara:strand:- start:561 stop:1433 length:873 start_codon:yes stop_codon:yes gene_type:complete
MSDVFKYVDLSEVELRSPKVVMVLKPWIDVGRVGTKVIRFLRDALGAEILGTMINPSAFYDYTIYRPRTYFLDGKRIFRQPQTRLYYAKRPEKEHDLILMEMLEPHINSEEFIDAITELADKFDISEYTMIGGMYDMVPHTRPLVVSSITNNPDLLDSLNEFQVRESDYEGPTSITMLIQQILRDRNITTNTFVVHLPQYLEIDVDFSGQARIMEILCALYDFPLKYVDKQQGETQYIEAAAFIQNSEDITNLVDMLEQSYDSTYLEIEDSLTELSPDIEEFLKDIGGTL